MIDYVIGFHDNNIVLFYFLLVIAVILEGPISVIFLSLVAPKLGIGYFQILFFSFLGDFLGDLLHYFVGHFSRTKIMKNKNWEKLENLNKRLDGHSLFDKLIVIKYTPPITSIGLLYLGFRKIPFFKFLKNDFVIVSVSSIIISSIAYNFGTLFKSADDFYCLIIAIFVIFVIIYFFVKIISKYIIKRIIN